MNTESMKKMEYRARRDALTAAQAVSIITGDTWRAYQLEPGWYAVAPAHEVPAGECHHLFYAGGQAVDYSEFFTMSDWRQT